jgi:putative transcriptional regulator
MYNKLKLGGDIMRVKSNLKAILDERKISIRQFSEETGLQFETLRRLYNDETKQYQRDTLGRVCEVLGVEINELLILVNEENDPK